MKIYKLNSIGDKKIRNCLAQCVTRFDSTYLIQTMKGDSIGS